MSRTRFASDAEVVEEILDYFKEKTSDFRSWKFDLEELGLTQFDYLPSELRRLVPQLF